MIELRRLLALVPRRWRRDPEAVPAIVVDWAGSSGMRSVAIADNTLTLQDTARVLGASYVYSPGADPFLLPALLVGAHVTDVAAVQAPVAFTELLVRGGGTTDTLVTHVPVVSVSSVDRVSPPTHYTAPTDYSLVGNGIHWVSGHGPTTGATLRVTGIYQKAMVPDVDFAFLPAPVSAVTFAGLSGDQPVNGMAFTVDYDYALPPLDLDLATLTLDALVDVLAVTGTVAVLADGPEALGRVSALALLEMPATDITNAVATLSYWSNPHWRLFETLGAALAGGAARVDAAVAQLTLLLSAGEWADFWGTLTGIPRQSGEGDGDYTTRQRYEIQRPRENNQALAAVLENDLGVVVTETSDAVRDVLRVPGPWYGRSVPGPDVNAAVGRIGLLGWADQRAAALAQAHAAGGVTVVVVGTIVLGLASPYRLALRHFQIGGAGPFTVGTTAVGTGKVGP